MYLFLQCGVLKFSWIRYHFFFWCREIQGINKLSWHCLAFKESFPSSKGSLHGISLFILLIILVLVRKKSLKLSLIKIHSQQDWNPALRLQQIICPLKCRALEKMPGRFPAVLWVSAAMPCSMFGPLLPGSFEVSLCLLGEHQQSLTTGQIGGIQTFQAGHFRSAARNPKLNVELSKELDTETCEVLGRLSYPNRSGGTFLTIN